MKRILSLTAALATAVAFSITPVPAAAADQCRTSCNNSFTTCSKGKTSEECLPGWGQCKAKCKRTTSAVAARKTTPKAAPAKATPMKTASR